MADAASIDDNNNDSKQRKEEKEEEWHLPSSPILATRYAHRSSELIYSIERNFYWIIALICILFTLSLLDILEIKIHHIFPFSLDTPIIIFLGILMAALGYTFRSIQKSRRMLESWADLFERNSIRAGMDISMAKKTKEEALLAIAETVEEIGEPLRDYISSKKDNFNEFLNISIDNSKSIIFDVLIDSKHVRRIDNNQKISNDLIGALEEFGAIIIKIIDGAVTNDTIESFSKQVKYYSTSTKNKVHLAIIIGDDASEEAYKLAIKSERKGTLDYIVVVEKPFSSSSSSSSLFVT
jgi:hypothetical protein